MRYIFENGNSDDDQPKNTKNSKYTLWMNSILRRSKEIGKVELPICSIILDERGRCIGSCLLYTSPSPRDKRQSRMPSSA